VLGGESAVQGAWAEAQRLRDVGDLRGVVRQRVADGSAYALHERGIGQDALPGSSHPVTLDLPPRRCEGWAYRMSFGDTAAHREVYALTHLGNLLGVSIAREGGTRDLDTLRRQFELDMFMLYNTPSGKELWRRIEAAEQPITIVPESDPHNSFAAPNDWGDANAGIPTGSTVRYNPDVAMRVFDSSGNQIDEPPQLVLGHEMVHRSEEHTSEL